MKLIQIFGAVVAIHAVALLVIFASPGCASSRSTTTGDPDPVAVYPETGDDFGLTPVPVGPGELADVDLNPGVAGAAAPRSEQTAPSPSGRAAPTRPTPEQAVFQPIEPPQTARPVVTYEVKSGDSLWSIARAHGITHQELARANQLDLNAVLRIGQKLVVPGQEEDAAVTAAPGGAEPPSGRTYTVRSGDTLSTIARRTGVDVDAIRRLNGLSGDLIRVGQTLMLPADATPPSEPERARAPSPQPPRGSVVHVVRSGETLGGIASRYGVTVTEIASANLISDPARIRVGQELVIPGYEAVPTPSEPEVRATRPAAETPPPPPREPSPPAPTEDLDAGLLFDDNDIPVIRIEDTGAPRIE